jgi:hypothetical protein
MDALSQILMVLFAVTVIGIFVLTIVGEVVWCVLAVARKINRKYGPYEAVKVAAFGTTYYFLLWFLAEDSKYSKYGIWFLTFFMVRGFLNRPWRKVASK